jgi:hypothetical protein
MARKNRKKPTEKYDLFDDFDDFSFDEDLDLERLSRNLKNEEWGDPYDRSPRGSSRRQIERRQELKRLYSELNDWEEFGETEHWASS